MHPCVLRGKPLGALLFATFESEFVHCCAVPMMSIRFETHVAIDDLAGSSRSPGQSDWSGYCQHSDTQQGVRPGRGCPQMTGIGQRRRLAAE